MIQINLRLFGTFRKYESLGNPLSLNIKKPATVDKVKKALSEYFLNSFNNFADTQLIEDSAIADEKQILTKDHILDESCTLLILPPVCGG